MGPAKQHFRRGTEKSSQLLPQQSFHLFKSNTHVYFSQKIAALLFLREQIEQP